MKLIEFEFGNASKKRIEDFKQHCDKYRLELAGMSLAYTKDYTKVRVQVSVSQELLNQRTLQD